MVQEVEQQAMEYFQVAMTEQQEVNQACVQVLQFAYACGVSACWTVFDQSTLFRDGGIFHTVHPYGLPGERILPWQWHMCGKPVLSALKYLDYLHLFHLTCE